MKIKVGELRAPEKKKIWRENNKIHRGPDTCKDLDKRSLPNVIKNIRANIRQCKEKQGN